MARWLALAPVLVALATSNAAGAQTGDTDPAQLAVIRAPGTSPPDRDPLVPHPVFGALALSGEFGANYAAGLKLAFLANPFPAGVSFGGSAFAAPLTHLQDGCTGPCNLSPALYRWMAELRLGTPFTDQARGLAWLGLSAGVAYLVEPHMDPSPTLAVAGGGDVRLAGSLWFEVSLRLTGARMLGSDAAFVGTYFTFGLDVGVRFDLVH